MVICFPGMEEPQYVNRDGFSEEGLSETEIQSDNRSKNDEDENAGNKTVFKSSFCLV